MLIIQPTTDDILDFSKLEQSKLDLAFEPFSLRSCVEGSLDLLAEKAAAQDLELVLDYSENDVHVRVILNLLARLLTIYSADGRSQYVPAGFGLRLTNARLARLRQIIVNLVSNACVVSAFAFLASSSLAVSLSAFLILPVPSVKFTLPNGCVLVAVQVDCSSIASEAEVRIDVTDV